VTLLAAVLTLVLSAIAFLHAYWGVGGVWPGVDAASCARTVGGFPGVNSMPGPGPCFAVAAALAVAALLAAAEGGLFLPLPSALLDIATLGAALVFLGRGIVGFTPGWRRLTPEQPFATLDVRYYSPLCLAIGAGLAMLAIKGFSA
jgi:hypothetical protein